MSTINAGATTTAPTCSSRRATAASHRRTHRGFIPSAAQIAVREKFERERECLSWEMWYEIDRKVTGGAITAATRRRGTMHIVWNPHYRTTAGDNTVCILAETIGGHQQFGVEIQLGEHAVTDVVRLWRTLACEFCHVASFIIDGRPIDDCHGSQFAKWAQAIENALPEKGVTVPRRERYDIDYRYAWVCSGAKPRRIEWVKNEDGSWTYLVRGGCGARYPRHSKSIDPATRRCRCRGHLVQVRPKRDARIEFQDLNRARVKAALKRLVGEDVDRVHVESVLETMFTHNLSRKNLRAVIKQMLKEKPVASPDEMDLVQED